MKVIAVGLLALLSTFVLAQGSGEDIDIKATSQSRSETSVSTDSRKSWSFTGHEVAVGRKFRNTKDSWGKTKQDVVAMERQLISEAKGRGELIVDHSSRISGRTYDMGLGKRTKDGISIDMLPREFIVRMIHRRRGDTVYWATGTISAREVMLGRKVGYQLEYTILDDGKVLETEAIVYELSSCFRCDNQTIGLVYTERSIVKHVPVLREEFVRTETLREKEYVERQAPAPIVYNIMVAQYQGQGPIMNPTTQYFGAPMAPFYLIRGRDGKCRVVCDSKYCDPKDRPDLPPPPPPPGGDGGTPPNNDENRSRQKGG